ncbi:MAG: YqgE/AlgH family protein [Hyphomicrobiaceae bacterium]|nr:YqgE/AlgH family protein [Hyphomicrobiaceae bacterium]
MTKTADITDLQSQGFLDGQLLIAMPRMSDRRFQRSVIYLCAHSEQGAMGLIVNQNAEHIDFPDLLERLGLVPEDDAEDTGIELPNDLLTMPIHIGGPVETGRGFVLHSSDYFATEATLPIRDGICLTATLDILRAIAAGKGPVRSLLALGYAGWSPGQLESEIQANGWLHCPADMDLVFDDDNETKYLRALAKIGIDPSHLVSDAGHA